MFCFCRVIGNLLPPKDSMEERLDSIKFVIEQDKEISVEKTWILNRIIDQDYLESVRDLLADQSFIEIPFIKEDYYRTSDRIHYLTNINAARNTILKHYFNYFDYLVSLDQDCFFTKSIWKDIEQIVLNNNKKYYGLPSKRILNLEDIWNEPDNEAMLIFTKQSTLFFDEHICFGKDDKRTLLRQLGYNNKWQCNSEECMTAGNVLHIGYDDRIERDIGYRVAIRQKALDHLVHRANSLLLL